MLILLLISSIISRLAFCPFSSKEISILLVCTESRNDGFLPVSRSISMIQARLNLSMINQGSDVDFFEPCAIFCS